jgi:hypothetical protein
MLIDGAFDVFIYAQSFVSSGVKMQLRITPEGLNPKAEIF